MSYKVFLDFLIPMTNPKAGQQGKGNLSFAGNGKVSVPVNSLLSSARVKEQIEAVRELAKTIDLSKAAEGLASKSKGND